MALQKELVALGAAPSPGAPSLEGPFLTKNTVPVLLSWIFLVFPEG